MSQMEASRRVVPPGPGPAPHPGLVPARPSPSAAHALPAAQAVSNGVQSSFSGSSSVQKLLEENNGLIKTIAEHQQMGKAHECFTLYQSLHKNLLMLARLTEPGNTNIHLPAPDPNVFTRVPQAAPLSASRSGTSPPSAVVHPMRHQAHPSYPHPYPAPPAQDSGGYGHHPSARGMPMAPPQSSQSSEAIKSNDPSSGVLSNNPVANKMMSAPAPAPVPSQAYPAGPSSDGPENSPGSSGMSHMSPTPGKANGGSAGPVSPAVTKFTAPATVDPYQPLSSQAQSILTTAAPPTKLQTSPPGSVVNPDQSAAQHGMGPPPSGPVSSTSGIPPYYNPSQPSSTNAYTHPIQTSAGGPEYQSQLQNSAVAITHRVNPQVNPTYPNYPPGAPSHKYPSSAMGYPPQPSASASMYHPSAPGSYPPQHYMNASAQQSLPPVSSSAGAPPQSAPFTAQQRPIPQYMPPPNSQGGPSAPHMHYQYPGSAQPQYSNPPTSSGPVPGSTYPYYHPMPPVHHGGMPSQTASSAQPPHSMSMPGTHYDMNPQSQNPMSNPAERSFTPPKQAPPSMEAPASQAPTPQQ